MDRLPLEFVAQADQVLARNTTMRAAGFEEDECGLHVAEGCRVSLYPCFDEYEIDITLADGTVLSFDVPTAKVSWSEPGATTTTG